MSARLEGVRLFLLDLDGVIMRGTTPVKGAAEAVSRLRSCGARLMFTTNNSTRSRGELMEWLKEAGIDVKIGDLLTTAHCAAQYAVTKGWKRVHIIGEKGLREECEEAGLEVVTEEDEDCDAVIVGLDRAFTYKKLGAALKLVQRGAKFIATNTDATLPTELGEIPGAAAMVSSLEACSKEKPLVVLGKPNPHLMELALGGSSYTLGECCVVGDRPDTDMAMAKRVGCLGILVLTGVATMTKREDYPPSQRPNLIFSSLTELALQYEKSRRGRGLKNARPNTRLLRS